MESWRGSRGAGYRRTQDPESCMPVSQGVNGPPWRCDDAPFARRAWVFHMTVTVHSEEVNALDGFPCDSVLELLVR